jgi:hypothetical protein
MAKKKAKKQKVTEADVRQFLLGQGSCTIDIPTSY